MLFTIVALGLMVRAPFISDMINPRSVLQDYSVLRPTNVLGTIEVARLAIPRKIPLHFVSTLSVLKAGHSLVGEELLTNNNMNTCTNGYALVSIT